MLSQIQNPMERSLNFSFPFVASLGAAHRSFRASIFWKWFGLRFSISCLKSVSLYGVWSVFLQYFLTLSILEDCFSFQSSKTDNAKPGCIWIQRGLIAITGSRGFLVSATKPLNGGLF